MKQASRDAGSCRPAAFESFEPRLLLAVDYPDPLDQMLLEYINRARSDPVASEHPCRVMQCGGPSIEHRLRKTAAR